MSSSLSLSERFKELLLSSGSLQLISNIIFIFVIFVHLLIITKTFSEILRNIFLSLKARLIVLSGGHAFQILQS